MRIDIIMLQSQKFYNTIICQKCTDNIMIFSVFVYLLFAICLLLFIYTRTLSNIYWIYKSNDFIM